MTEMFCDLDCKWTQKTEQYCIDKTRRESIL